MARGARGTSKPLGRPGETEEEAMARFTPFARALQEWLWTGRGLGKSPWSRRRLADELEGVSLSAVDSWFSRGTLPEPTAFWELVRVTGWQPDYLAHLAGYDGLPPQVQGPFTFLREHALEYFRNNDRVAGEVLRFIDDMQREYDTKPRRPQRKRRASATAAGAPAEPPLPASAAPDERPAKTRKELANAGK